MYESPAHRINLAVMKHYFARSNTFNLQREDGVASRFGAKNRRQVPEWGERCHAPTLASINDHRNHACHPCAPRIILAATLSRRCENLNVLMFCHDYSSLQTFSDHP